LNDQSGGRRHTANLSYAGGLELPPARHSAKREGADPVPALLGRDVPRCGGFWNFLDTGVFGFLINLPIVSYYEIGTALTANHGHASMMGIYGMLPIGLALFCLRYIVPEKYWSDKAARTSFWALNLRPGMDGLCHAVSLGGFCSYITRSV